ncbi:pentatricopeptide repeat-containing protein At1g52620 [Phoenix dactylifera]|uniref:Pentatricopeptide repeat-containing protein At1g52620 n=1 Tax=Phoenix dactylifera TaxID=42345 RepID=A0A8B8J772_PHODC|nr:pentatricopeptide repeat-containing protein At1g52620 [Phoenix dactylifera]XP_017699492.2 pentatricopeptide repeat-containing protein At1g52620 [Phoenix dactylifera]XP_026662354.2 pentatricopeptide repeat-containing protein At1g52620 [Phoenix dactylifera]XP_026662355.2 pentatricopeptide repeat-containing protein At1g52620 [Phoenix dactylifera]
MRFSEVVNIHKRQLLLLFSRSFSPPCPNLFHMSKLFLLPPIKKPRQNPFKFFLSSRLRRVADSIAQILRTRETNPHWERALDDAFSLEEEEEEAIAPVLARLPDPDSALAFFDWARRRRPPWADPPDSLSYSTLLRILAKARRFPEIELVLQTMRSEERTPTREALGALVAAYSDSGLEEEALDVYRTMRDQLGSFPDVSDCNCLLKLLVERRHCDLARQVYDEMLKRDGGADNYSTGIMVRGLCIEGRMDEAKNLIEHRWGAGCTPNVVFYNTLLDGYCRNGDMKRGLELFREMKLKGFLPTLVSYGIVINGFCKKGNFVEINKFFSEMKARGLWPNVQIYNNVIDAWCKHGSVVKAKAVLRQMIGSGCEPDIVTYNILISGLCQGGNVGEAELLLREAIKRRLDLNKFSYTPIIHGYCQNGEVAMASNLFIEMMEKGHKPDLVIYAALIHGLVLMQEINDALAIREKMIEKGVTLDAGIHNILISGLCKKGMLASAKKLLAEMLDQNILPDEFVYATLIDGFIRNEDLSEAKKVFEFMGQKGIRHGVVGYNAMIKGYCKFGMMNDAILCINSMRRDGYCPDEFTYTTVIDGYAKQSDLDGALSVFGDMMKRRCKPNVVTYSALINGYCRKGDIDTAEILFNNMQSHGLIPNVVTYSILIGSFCKNKQITRAVAFFEEMLSNKCPPNDVTFHYLINGLINSTPYLDSTCATDLQGNSKIAFLDIFVNMISDGWDRRSAAYNAIIFCLCKHQMVTKALELRGKMVAKGCLPNSITFLFLLHGICAEGKSAEWKSILSCHFQQNELEIAFKYTRLLDQHLHNGTTSKASWILQSLLEESIHLLGMEHGAASR